MPERMQEVTLDRLLGALPEHGELAALRHALMSASRVDATQVWSSASAYTTYDKRALTPEALAQALAQAAQAAHARVDALYAAVERVLRALSANDPIVATNELLAIGGRLQAEENSAAAIGWFAAAERIAERANDRALRAFALRQLGVAYLAQGSSDAAEAHYRASLEQAVAADSAERRIDAHIGLGNLAGYQGRFHDGLHHFEAALEICGNDFPHRRGVLFTNMAFMLSEQGLLIEASARLADASDLWSDLTPADHSRWYNGRGMLALKRGEIEMAESLLHQALEIAPSEFERAMVLDNLAELFIQQGNLSEAESLARSAEEAALRAGSPRALAEIYTRLGKIFRLRADMNGVTFFEKAVEICRGRRYPHTEANAYLEYGMFRRLHGDLEEARSYFERAKQLFGQAGAESQERFAADQLAVL